jgi:hypothetical protein
MPPKPVMRTLAASGDAAIPFSRRRGGATGTPGYRQRRRWRAMGVGAGDDAAADLRPAPLARAAPRCRASRCAGSGAGAALAILRGQHGDAVSSQGRSGTNLQAALRLAGTPMPRRGFGRVQTESIYKTFYESAPIPLSGDFAGTL